MAGCKLYFKHLFTYNRCFQSLSELNLRHVIFDDSHDVITVEGVNFRLNFKLIIVVVGRSVQNK